MPTPKNWTASYQDLADTLDEVMELTNRPYEQMEQRGDVTPKHADLLRALNEIRGIIAATP